MKPNSQLAARKKAKYRIWLHQSNESAVNTEDLRKKIYIYP